MVCHAKGRFRSAVKEREADSLASPHLSELSTNLFEYFFPSHWGPF